MESSSNANGASDHTVNKAAALEQAAADLRLMTPKGNDGQAAEGVSFKYILPDEHDHQFYANHNPFYAATLILSLRTMTDEIGTATASCNGVLFGVCHLYNALQQFELTELEWPDLEKIMALHCTALFANDVPKTPETMARRIKYRNGSGVTQFTYYVKSLKEFNPSTATEILKPFFREGGTLGRAIYLLGQKVKGKEKARIAEDSPRRRRLEEVLKLIDEAQEL